MEGNLTRCKKHLSLLCYVCGLFTGKPKQIQLNSKVKDFYKNKFKMDIKEKSYTLNQVCINCYSFLCEERHKRKPVSLMIWKKPNEMHTNCYACLIPSFTGFRWDTRIQVKYPNYPTTNSKHHHVSEQSSNEPNQQPQLETKSPQPGPSTAQPTSAQPTSAQLSSPTLSTLAPFLSSSSQSSSEEYNPPQKIRAVPLDKAIGQSSFNDIIQAMEVQPKKAEVLESRLQEREFLKPETNITILRKEKSFNDKFCQHNI